VVPAKFRDARERIESGAPINDACMTVAAWLEDWITKSLAASDRKQATKKLYATLARIHSCPRSGTTTCASRRWPPWTWPWASMGFPREATLEVIDAFTGIAGRMRPGEEHAPRWRDVAGLPVP
jgi:hypothetical protein